MVDLYSDTHAIAEVCEGECDDGSPLLPAPGRAAQHPRAGLADPPGLSSKTYPLRVKTFLRDGSASTETETGQ